MHHIFESYRCTHILLPLHGNLLNYYMEDLKKELQNFLPSLLNIIQITLYSLVFSW